ncbi:hypothetical protein E8E15_001323 [Penicillium rubens]|nr:hypothetical protein E8E15_001323 [Penicillium rubens]KAJ5051060.1 hypothetical protein NUH16_011028 [Penicillium rubens]
MRAWSSTDSWSDGVWPSWLPDLSSVRASQLALVNMRFIHMLVRPTLPRPAYFRRSPSSRIFQKIQDSE